MRRLIKIFIKFLVITNLFFLVRKFLNGSDTTSRLREYVFYPERKIVYNLITKIKSENEMLMEDDEAYRLFILLKRTTKIKGDVAEIGVYKGGSAKLICEAKGDKNLHLFDTFEGLPTLSSEDDRYQFFKGQFAAVLEDTKNYLKDYKNVFFYPGLFPKTSDPVKNNKFSFVHLDVDLYESTSNCLNFFYPKMARGGVILSHDYVNSIGVRKAFDDFFKDKSEYVIELSGTQCAIVKL